MVDERGEPDEATVKSDQAGHEEVEAQDAGAGQERPVPEAQAQVETPAATPGGGSAGAAETPVGLSGEVPARADASPAPAGLEVGELVEYLKPGGFDRPGTPVYGFVVALDGERVVVAELGAVLALPAIRVEPVSRGA
jgi:hypothetical protein